MGKRGPKDAYEYTEDADDVEQSLLQIGQQLRGGVPKAKDALLKALKSARASLEQAPQGSAGAKLAIGDLAKALARREVLKHKDKEVRLYAAKCLSDVLRVFAPDTPFSDAELKDIFELFNVAYRELEDPSSAHFQLCLSVFEAVSQVKCSVLLWDLDAEETIVELFNTVFGAYNDENERILEATALELLGGMLADADDIPQSVLDAVLSQLLPHRTATAAAGRLAKALLRQQEDAVKPVIMTFLTETLLGTGVRRESELVEDVHALIYQLYEAIPTALLPVLPHLSLEIQVESDAKRLTAVELLGKIFTQQDGREIMNEYREQADDLLKRLHDAKTEIRLKVLSFCKGLLDNATDVSMRTSILQGIQDRLMDVDDRVRSAAVATFCDIAADQPHLGMGPSAEQLLNRLRDKKVAVRKEAAAQVAGLLRKWVMKKHQQEPNAPKRLQVIQQLLVLCNVSARDPELSTYVMDTVFRAGVLPPKLPLPEQARWWCQIWRYAGKPGHEAFASILRSKHNLQRSVRELLQLRDAVKERRQAAGAATSSRAGSGTGTGAQPSTSAAGGVGDPEKTLQMRLLTLARALQGVHKPEEGLQKLFVMKDNHIFRGLATVAAYGTTLEAATATGKDVLQRVGSKGPAAEVARALVGRMAPTLLSPELLHTVMEQAGENKDAQDLLVDVAGISPQLFARSLDPLVSMLESDDPLLANCAIMILSKAARYLSPKARSQQQQQRAGGSGGSEEDGTRETQLDKVEGTLLAMCSGSSPSVAKAAVFGLVTLRGAEHAERVLRPMCATLMDCMKQPSTLSNHPKLLTALKAMAAIGRTLPQLFAEHADELVEFVLDQLLVEDLSEGKPLKAVTEETGEQWGRPSPGVEIKAAAIKALAQGFVPDGRQGFPAAAAGTAKSVLERLVALLNPDEESEAFECIGLEGRIDGGWVRCAAASGVLRLARAHDHGLTADQYIELALSLQDPHPEARKTLALKVQRAVTFFSQKPEKAAKYAAMLCLLAVDPDEGNQERAFRALQAYVTTRRKALQLAAQVAAAAGGGGGMIQDMPEFMLPYVIFILAHHPDYPGAEELEEWEGMDEEEREEAEEAGQGHPLAPFQTMLQFVLEALVIPPEAPSSASEIAQTVPPTLKLLRSIKFCEDASPDPRTGSAHQLCDIALALVRALEIRAAKGNPQEPGRFPGGIVLPRMCFVARPDPRADGKRFDGGDLPPNFVPQLTEHLFFQRFGGGAGQPQQQRKAGRSKPRRRPPGGGEEVEQDVSSQPSGEASDMEDDGPRASSKQKGVKRRAAGEDTGGQRQAKRAAPGSAQKKRKKGGPQAQSPAERQQPRRGAKAVAAGKLRDESSGEGGETDEEDMLPASKPFTRRLASPAAARPAANPPGTAAGGEEDDDPMAQSDFEGASMGRSPPVAVPGGRGGSAAARQQQAQRPKSALRADTEDEESSREEEGGSSPRAVAGNRRVGGAKPAAGGKKPAAGSKGAAQKRRSTRASPSAALKPRSKNVRA